MNGISGDGSGELRRFPAILRHLVRLVLLIRSETEFAAEEAEHGYEEEEVQGAARRSSPTGAAARTPSLPGSRYCGIESHQALANIDTDNVADLRRRRRHRRGARRERRPLEECGRGAADRPTRPPQPSNRPRSRPPRSRRHSRGPVPAASLRRLRPIAPKSELLRIARRAPARRPSARARAVLDPRASCPVAGPICHRLHLRDGPRDVSGTGHSPRRIPRALRRDPASSGCKLVESVGR